MIIDDSVLVIGVQVFFGCSNMISVTLPSSLVTIDNQTFLGCNILGSIAIPDTVTTINASAFQDAYALAEVSFGASSQLTTIAGNGFHHTTALTRITLPEMTGGTIATSVWGGSSGLSTVYMSIALATYLGTLPSASPQSFYGASDVYVVTLAITGTIVALDNTTLTVTFNDAAYNTDGGTGSLETSDFVFSLVGGTATLASTEPSSISEVGNEYTLGLDLTGTPDGSEVVTVNPASYTSIYDAYGGPASITQSNNTGNLSEPAPTMIISSPAITVLASTNTQVIPLRFTSSEVTSDFVAGGITSTNGTISNFTEDSDDTNSYSYRHGSGGVYTRGYL